MKIRTWILAGIVLLLSSAPSEATILYETLEDMSQEAKVIIQTSEEEVSEWKAPEPLTLNEIGLPGVLPQGWILKESVEYLGEYEITIVAHPEIQGRIFVDEEIEEPLYQFVDNAAAELDSERFTVTRSSWFYGGKAVEFVRIIDLKEERWGQKVLALASYGDKTYGISFAGFQGMDSLNAYENELLTNIFGPMLSERPEPGHPRR